MVVAARRWIELVDRVAESASLDIEHLTESLDDQLAEHRIGNLPDRSQKQASERLFQSRVQRGRERIAKAKTARAEIRKTLHLDDED